MKVISHPIRAQTLFYLIRCQHLRIDEVVKTHILKEFPILGQQVLVVIDTGKCPLGTERVSNQTCRHVLRLVRRNRDKEVTVFDAYIPQVMDRGRITYLRQHIVVGTKIPQTILTFVQETDLHIFTTQQFRQVCTYFTCTCNNDSHIPSLSNLSI